MSIVGGYHRAARCTQRRLERTVIPMNLLVAHDAERNSVRADQRSVTRAPIRTRPFLIDIGPETQRKVQLRDAGLWPRDDFSRGVHLRIFVREIKRRIRQIDETLLVLE